MTTFDVQIQCEEVTHMCLWCEEAMDGAGSMHSACEAAYELELNAILDDELSPWEEWEEPGGEG